MMWPSTKPGLPPTHTLLAGEAPISGAERETIVPETATKP